MLSPGRQSPQILLSPEQQAEAAREVHTSLELIDELYNYNHWLFTKVRPWITGSVCEVGSGIGNITQFLLSAERVVCIEPYQPAIARLKTRFADHLNVSLSEGVLQDCPNDTAQAGSFETVICLNVLEHIEDDVEALSIMRTLCRPDGHVVILVPAHMSAYGEMDRSFGHVRRYNKRSLRRAFESANMEPVSARYINAIGYFGWIWDGRIRKRNTISVGSARTFNKLVPYVDALERLMPMFFGQSLVMVAKPAAD